MKLCQYHGIQMPCYLLGTPEYFKENHDIIIMLENDIMVPYNKTYSM